MSEQALVPVVVVCAGRRRDVTSKGGKLHVELRTDDGAPHYFKAKGETGRLVVGGRYEVQASGPDLGTIVPKYRYLGTVAEDEPAQVAAWLAASRAADVAARAARDEAREKRRDAVAELLRPIRKQYARLDSTGRRALEVVVLAALRQEVVS